MWGLEAWMVLGAAATQTERIKLGTMLTPLPWASPWKVASQTVTLDHLSNGRAILSVGLGANDTGAGNFGVATERKIKAELLDEGLEIVTGLWQGQPFSHESKHYTLKPTPFPPPPPPVQQPRIPIWVVGAWPKEKSMARVAKYDGILPMKMKADGAVEQIGMAEVPAIKTYVAERRTLTTPFEVIVEGATVDANDTATVQGWAEAGATWWIEALWGKEEEVVLKRLRQGPPQK
jgi:alkanesulfonate monooxygenase SsuD/methylene tetrahydromethanopterin reductase-like flavin-dependent oxidoreductase (luciferase family)